MFEKACDSKQVYLFPDICFPLDLFPFTMVEETLSQATKNASTVLWAVFNV